jgi:predicted nucleic acid-binding protein
MNDEAPCAGLSQHKYIDLRFYGRRAFEGAQSLLAEPFIINVQALNELAAVGRRKLKMSWDEIESAIAAILALANAVVPIDEKITLEAIRLAARYNVSFYDAAMVA